MSLTPETPRADASATGSGEAEPTPEFEFDWRAWPSRSPTVQRGEEPVTPKIEDTSAPSPAERLDQPELLASVPADGLPEIVESPHPIPSLAPEEPLTSDGGANEPGHESRPESPDHVLPAASSVAEGAAAQDAPPLRTSAAAAPRTKAPAPARSWLSRARARLGAVGRRRAASPVHRLREGEIEVAAYSDDCLIRGRMVLPTRRMSDVVAASPSVALRDARLVALDDGREIDVPELDVGRDELVAIEAAGPRGDPNRRRRTVPHPVVVRAGPYRIWGDAHAMPGADPIATARWRNPNLPLTDVRVRYLLKGSPVEEQISVLVVNLELVDSLIDAEMQRWEAEAEFERDMAASVDGVH